MRTNIIIDDNLMQQTLQATGIKTKKEAVEQGLKLLLQKANNKKSVTYGANCIGKTT